MMNKHGQTRLSQYYNYQPLSKRVVMEAEVVRKCLMRSENQVSKLQRYKINNTNRKINRSAVFLIMMITKSSIEDMPVYFLLSGLTREKMNWPF
jgi:hypothetical protein